MRRYEHRRHTRAPAQFLHHTLPRARSNSHRITNQVCTRTPRRDDAKRTRVRVLTGVYGSGTDVRFVNSRRCNVGWSTRHCFRMLQIGLDTPPPRGANSGLSPSQRQGSLVRAVGHAQSRSRSTLSRLHLPAFASARIARGRGTYAARGRGACFARGQGCRRSRTFLRLRRPDRGLTRGLAGSDQDAGVRT